MKNKALLLLAAVAALSFTGCTTVHYKDASGAEFSTTSVLTKRSISKVDVKAGDKTVKIQGFTNDQVEAVAAITEAAVAGAVKGAK